MPIKPNFFFFFSEFQMDVTNGNLVITWASHY
jgi:hypothetical protein